MVNFHLLTSVLLLSYIFLIYIFQATQYAVIIFALSSHLSFTEIWEKIFYIYPYSFYLCCSSFLCIDPYFYLALFSFCLTLPFAFLAVHICWWISQLLWSEKVFIVPIFFKYIISGYRILDWQVFSSTSKLLLTTFLLAYFWQETCCPSKIFPLNIMFCFTVRF